MASASSLNANFIAIALITMTEKITKRELQRLETRERIYRSAISEFLEVGFDKAQIENIVKQADVSVGSFYRNFPTKNDVIIELMNRYLAEIAGIVASRLEKDGQSLDTLLEALIDPIFDILEREKDNPLIREVFATVMKIPPGNMEWVEHPFLQQVISTFSIHCGNSGYDPVRLVRLFFTSMFGFITIMNPVRSRAEAFEFIKIFLDGIAVKA